MRNVGAQLYLDINIERATVQQQKELFYACAKYGARASIKLFSPSRKFRKIEKKSEVTTHAEIKCDGCGMFPIVGIRYTALFF